MKEISVVLATHNEEENIKDCLDTIKNLADEIIIIDGSSTDKTVAIAKKYQARVFITSNKIMFHTNKQLALEKASKDWILQLDADERVTPALKKEITSVINNEGYNYNGYYIPRKNYFLGKWLKKGGQYPDYVIRLVKRGKAIFPCKSVHEQIKVEGKVGNLKNDLIHLSNTSFSHYFRNANRYTNLQAIEMKTKNIGLGWKNQFNYLFWLPLITFFNLFLRHKGFIDGFYGFLFAVLSGFHFPIAFIKYWEMEKVKNKT